MNQINNSKKIYHAAIYVRLSKEDGDVATAGKRESNSISNQKDLIKNFLKDKKDIVVVSERVDDGYSGSNFERPAFQMMLEDIKKGNYNPFSRSYIMEEFDEQVRQMLIMMIAEVCREFEKLPIIKYTDILRNILYSGVWCRFEAVSGKRKKEQEKENV